MLKWIILFLILNINVCFAQVPAGQIQKSQEILEKEKELRQRIEKPQKQFVKKIEVKGASLLSEQELQEITLPFERRWLTRADIQKIMDLIIDTYEQKGYNATKLKLSYQIKNRRLKIQVEESRE